MDDSTTSTAEWFDIQNSDEIRTPTEVFEEVRASGRRTSRRTVSLWQSEGLIPPALRVGARGGVYPAVVAQLLRWVIGARERKLSTEAIRELLPLWKFLVRGRTHGEVDLRAFEDLARRSGLSTEANYAVPGVVAEVMSCLCGECLSKVRWTLKDGTTQNHAANSELTLKFILGEIEAETGAPQVVAWTQLTLPGLGTHPDLDEPSTIVLGLPLNVNFDRMGLEPSGGTSKSARQRHGARCRPRVRQEEAMLL